MKKLLFQSIAFILAGFCLMYIPVNALEDTTLDDTPSEQPGEQSEKLTEENSDASPTEKQFKVVDIDLGEFQVEMSVGSSQMLAPTAILIDADTYDKMVALYEEATGKPLDKATDDEYQLFLNWLFKPGRNVQPYYADMKTSDQLIRSFISRNPAIAIVNALGRVQAISPGKVKIQIRCANYIKSVVVTVSPKGSDPQEYPTEYPVPNDDNSFPSDSSPSGETTIHVRDLDFGEYEKKLEVGKTLALSVSVIPSNATNPEITYSSSNDDIATVNGLGRVTGVSSGEVRITAKADGVMRSITLTIEVKTDGIEVDNGYIVLKPGEEHTISATVIPDNAPQELTYKSSDENVASVDEEGVITAVSPGSTSVVVSNGSATSVISVIVNQEEETSVDETENTVVEEENAISPLALEIQNGSDSQTFIASGELVPIVTSDVLKVLYGTNKTLCVKFDNYSISITGNDIVNIDNELNTVLSFVETDDGILFRPNNGNQFPGKLSIATSNIDKKYKWLYLYNESLEKWQLLSSYENGVITIDTAGDYCIREKKEPLLPINWLVVAACSIIVIVGIIIYIITHKKYWFW